MEANVRVHLKRFAKDIGDVRATQSGIATSLLRFDLGSALI